MGPNSGNYVSVLTWRVAEQKANEAGVRLPNAVLVVLCSMWQFVI